MANHDDLFDFGSSSPKLTAKAKNTKPAIMVEPPIQDIAHKAQADSYSAADIEVLEGLEPVRRRPGMYIGGTDARALNHLFAEVIDNAMDEAVAGHADRIEVTLYGDNEVSVRDNGRGIPLEPHPKFPEKSALEVIMTTLHAGGKFGGGAYEASGGLHGVGISVVNALSSQLTVEVARNRRLYRQEFARGQVMSALQQVGETQNRRGTMVRFIPDLQIFGPEGRFSAETLFNIARSKAYLYSGVEIRWIYHERSALEAGDAEQQAAPRSEAAPRSDAGPRSDAATGSNTATRSNTVPHEARFHFPGGLRDYLSELMNGFAPITDDIFSGRIGPAGQHGSLEWAISWTNGPQYLGSYCNTIATSGGGTHEMGFRTGLLRSLKAYADLSGNKRAAIITGEDITGCMRALLSVFIKEPEFSGQTKERLSSAKATRIVENIIRDSFDHWLAGAPEQAGRLLEFIADQAEERLRRRQEREVKRKLATRKLRLPGKLADCSLNSALGTELFLVEGDSAGGSAKQARNRSNQAVLPLRGKILNVASAGRDKLSANQQLNDLILALGCGSGKNYNEAELRYEKIIIMTDADVDGAHIASLLITFFFHQMTDLIRNGHLFLANPPLYRLSQGDKVEYARDEAHRIELLNKNFNKKQKVEISRFKGLGEMRPDQLKQTAMDPQYRDLSFIQFDDALHAQTARAVSDLMGNKAEARFEFIRANARFVESA